MDSSALYLQLGKLLETMPDLTSHGTYPRETLSWLARANYLIGELYPGAHLDVVDFPIQMNSAASNSSIISLQNGLREAAAQRIMAMLHRAFAVAEFRAPWLQGSFVPVGNTFDATAALSKILGTAKKSVLIVAPYMDANTLTDFATLAPEKIEIRLLTDEATHKPGIVSALKAWRQQHANIRPAEARLAPARTLHDRMLAVDATQVWLLSQSLNAFASRSPATIVQIDGEPGKLKLDAYEAIWAGAKPI